MVWPRMTDLADIKAAHARIAEHIIRTPVIRVAALDELLGAAVYLKCEQVQAAGAFKSRGACNAVFSLSEADASRGVVTHSSGNHGAALARAAARRGITAHVVMPSTALPCKIDAVRRFGGCITFCQPTLADREAAAGRIIAETGATLIHPYNDDRIIAGQGTAALELLQDVPDLDLIIAPVGGGGLLSGTAICAKAWRPRIQVWAAEPAGADDAYRSWVSGQLMPAEQPRSVADGLLASLGSRTFPIIRRWVDNILLVQDAEIVWMVRWLHNEAQLLVEPSGAIGLAALRVRRAALRGRRVGVILSGGNFNLADLPTSVT